MRGRSHSARFGWQLLLHFLSLCPPPPPASQALMRFCGLHIVRVPLCTLLPHHGLGLSAPYGSAVQCSVDRRAVEMACGGTIATARQQIHVATHVIRFIMASKTARLTYVQALAGKANRPDGDNSAP